MDVGDLTGSAGLAGSGSISGVATGVGITSGTTSATAGWWTPTSTIISAPANTDVMNQLCRVCGEPAAGFHFGAFTCEGCKSFFGRTYNNLGSISECKNGGVCVINKKNRTACKACRLRKCLMVGMSKSGSRYGRRSNWFKIHCLLQEQSHQAQARLIKDPKSAYEKAFGSLDAANNNNNNNNSTNENASTTSATGVVGMMTTATTTVNSYHQHSHHQQQQHHHLHHPQQQQQQHNQDRLSSKRSDDTSSLRSQDPATRGQEVAQRTGQDQLLRANELVSRTPHELLRPEVSRFPIWRGSPFFHTALTHMQLFNAPFFPFQQRFIVPYVNQVGGPQMVASLSSSSSESVSPRSTPSPKAEEEDEEENDENRGSREAADDTGERGQRRGSSMGVSWAGTAKTTTSSVTPGTTATVPSEASYDKSVAFLRSLGPEQEAPIDLSMKATRVEGAGDTEVLSTEDERSTDSEENVLQDPGPPLDLTRKI